MKWKVFLLFILYCSQLQVLSKNSSPEGPIAVIRVYNPTKTGEPALVEVPIGSLATPNLINWKNVQLRCKDKFLPFSLREGKAHWRSELRSPILKPQAEDLLVFQISVAPGQWENVELVTGVPKLKESLTQNNGLVVINYPDMKITINEQTGLMTNLEAYGESLLIRPLELQFFEVGEGVVTSKGSMSSGYHRSVVQMKRIRELAPPVNTLVSWSSTGALTELNFVMKTDKGVSIALTYLIYPNNQIEILSDERPWQGRSPWLDCGLEYDLLLSGTKVYSLARHYDKQAAKVPGNMIAMTRADNLTLPFKERVNGYDNSLDNLIQIKQFDGLLSILTIPQLAAGHPFELKIELQNRGCIPWTTGAGYEIRLECETKLLGLPDQLTYEGAPIVFGDKRIFTLQGVVPAKSGEAQIKIDFIVPSRAIETLLNKTINFKW